MELPHLHTYDVHFHYKRGDFSRFLEFFEDIEIFCDIQQFDTDQSALAGALWAVSKLFAIVYQSRL